MGEKKVESRRKSSFSSESFFGHGLCHLEEHEDKVQRRCILIGIL